MPVIERSVTTSADPQAVWDYLSDFTTTTEWDPGTVRTVRVSGDGGIGTTYENKSRFMGRETRLTYVVVEASAPTRFQLRGENDQVSATDTMTFTPLGTGTRVDYRAEIVLKGKLRRLNPVLGLPVLGYPFKRLGDHAQRGMERALARL
jgi:carbon monoxide dehydrogenase subunit G